MSVKKVLHASMPYAVREEILDQYPEGFDDGSYIDIDWIDLSLAPITRDYIDSIDDNNPEQLDIYFDWSW